MIVEILWRNPVVFSGQWQVSGAPGPYIQLSEAFSEISCGPHLSESPYLLLAPPKLPDLLYTGSGQGEQLFLPTSLLDSKPTFLCTVVLRASRLHKFKLGPIDSDACRCTETRKKNPSYIKQMRCWVTFFFIFLLLLWCYCAKHLKLKEKNILSSITYISNIYNIYSVEWDSFQRLYLCQV